MEKNLLFMLILIMPFSMVAGSVHQQDEEHPLKVYPNPAHQEVNIKFFTDRLESPKIQVLDLTGKVVLRYEEDLNPEKNIFKASFDISQLRTGIYFVKVVQGKQTYSEKLVVK